jgi:hypothetical protein
MLKLIIDKKASINTADHGSKGFNALPAARILPGSVQFYQRSARTPTSEKRATKIAKDAPK